MASIPGGGANDNIRLPMPPNNTGDLYRPGNTPPADPDIAGIPLYLSPNYEWRLESGETLSNNARYTHFAIVSLATDLRDGFTDYTTFGNADSVFIPNKDGTEFKVIFVERRNRGQSNEYKKVYLNRERPTWPTNEL